MNHTNDISVWYPRSGQYGNNYLVRVYYQARPDQIILKWVGNIERCSLLNSPGNLLNEQICEKSPKYCYWNRRVGQFVSALAVWDKQKVEVFLYCPQGWVTTLDSGLPYYE